MTPGYNTDNVSKYEHQMYEKHHHCYTQIYLFVWTEVDLKCISKPLD